MTLPIPDPEDLAPAYRHLMKVHAASAGATPETGHLKRQSLAAHEFCTRAGHEVRFDHARKAWFLWSGQRWYLDRDDGIARLWLKVLGDRYQEALLLGDSDGRKATLASIHAAGATNADIRAGLTIAGSIEGVALKGDEWDPDPWSLGCENGVVDLRTGRLRPGRPEDMITRSTGIAYDPAAACPRWTRFVGEVLPDEGDLIPWFQRLIGASFIGTSKEILAVHFGGGNNGKSVCFATLNLVAGDYGVDIGIETLIGGRRDAGAATSDLMRLQGARLAFTSEPDQAARLKGGALKRLASIDNMTGRELHGRQMEWRPTHTLHVATNHLPEMEDGSDGLWRRVVLLVWKVHFRKAGEAGDGPMEDPRLKEDLAAEAAGILGWVVRGAVDFATAGLHPLPASVARETATYRADEDVLAGFISERLQPSPDGSVTLGTSLFESYATWAETSGLPRTERLNPKRFGRQFAERRKRLPWKVDRVLYAGRTAYRGVRVRDTEDSSGGFGGLGTPVPGSSPISPANGTPANDQGKPTKPTMPSESDRQGWDEDLAERATDDDAETA